MSAVLIDPELIFVMPKLVDEEWVLEGHFLDFNDGTFFSKVIRPKTKCHGSFTGTGLQDGIVAGNWKAYYRHIVETGEDVLKVFAGTDEHIVKQAKAAIGQQ